MCSSEVEGAGGRAFVDGEVAFLVLGTVIILIGEG